LRTHLFFPHILKKKSMFFRRKICKCQTWIEIPQYQHHNHLRPPINRLICRSATSWGASWKQSFYFLEIYL
jgi:hypothetical protein